MHELGIALLPGRDPRALTLVRSLRTFGGALAHTPVWMIAPADTNGLTVTHADDLAALDVQTITTPIDPAVLQFPFGAKVFAAAAAEETLRDQVARLAWLDPDTLFIQEPADLLIPDDAQIGYCPVHHRLIGPLYDQPLDPFWTLVYARCGAPEERAFPMRTVVGDEEIRPYVNAGALVVRPAAGLLRKWADQFAADYADPAFAAFYEQHALYRIFVHQAILSGVLLAALEPAAWYALPPTFNYPLHLYADDTPDRRPASINDLVTCRYEDVFAQPDWADTLPIHDPLKSWIAAEFTGGSDEQ